MSAGPKLAVNEHAPSRVRSGLIVGYGSIGERHLKNLRTIVPGIELTVVMQRPSVSSERVSLTADLEQALASKPSFAVIASPSYLHADQLLALLGAGVPCYIEKPVAVTLDQVRRLRAALELPAPPPITFAGCNLRFMPSLIKMKALLAQGAIGTPVRAHLQPWQWLPDWRPMREYTSGYSADAARGGGVMLDLIHEIDQARWLLGEFNQIAAVAAKASALAIDAEDSACVILRGGATGPVVAIGLDYVSRRAVRRYEIVGEEATLIWELGMQTLDIVRRDAREQVDCGGPGAFDLARTYVVAMTEFIACIERGDATSQDLREGLCTAELALRARAAAGP